PYGQAGFIEARRLGLFVLPLDQNEDVGRDERTLAGGGERRRARESLSQAAADRPRQRERRGAGGQESGPGMALRGGEALPRGRLLGRDHLAQGAAATRALHPRDHAALTGKGRLTTGGSHPGE